VYVTPLDIVQSGCATIGRIGRLLAKTETDSCQTVQEGERVAYFLINALKVVAAGL
jgi:hypothetical protein